MKVFLKENFKYLISLFQDSKEGLIILDTDKNIIYVNNFAKNLLGNLDNISKIEHYFSFDVCILNESEITTYNPLAAAILTKEDFKSECHYQVTQNYYKSLIIRAFNVEIYKIILISDFTSEIENIELKKLSDININKINELEKHNKDYSIMNDHAESQAIRVGLINRISASIRDTLDIDKITDIAITEISRTLGVHRGIFASFDNNTGEFTVKKDYCSNNSAKLKFNKNLLIKETFSSFKSHISIENIDSENSQSRLATPVIYQGNLLGVMSFYHINKRSWHAEEISLIEGISSQIAAAIYQASLFEKLENQKQELEQTLIKLKQTQIQLIQSEKMASLGQLVAGVAHEINTPIGSLNSNLNILIKYTGKLKEKVLNNPELKSFFKVLDEINEVNTEAIKRINAIIKSLKNFSRLDEAEIKKVDIHEGIKSSLMLVNHEIKHRITVIEEYGDLPLVECYTNLLNQVIMNLLVNAYQSIDGDGTILIRTTAKDNRIKILISDTGKGISEENLPKIFNPGFTTKGVGIGTGLGLSICYQIIEKHKGSLKVESKVGKGATFIIELPLSQHLNC